MNKTQEYLYALATDKLHGPLASVIKFFLFILSLAYGLVVEALIFLKRIQSRRLPCKVISVGNITLGGTGKTTAVEYIARYLDQAGRKVAVLSRGSGKKIPGSATCQDLRDEPAMLSKKLGGIPVITGADRIGSAEKAVAFYGADTVILDDGLQQWQIKKDLEIVTINSACAFGNGHLLPRGTLRQGKNCLRAADIFILTNTGLYPDTSGTRNILSRIKPTALIVETEHRPVGFFDLNKPGRLLAPDAFSGRPALLFCGIGDPEGFEKLAARLGIKAGLCLRFGDHHNYTAADLEKIGAAAKDKGCDILITTEKDAAKLQACPERSRGAPSSKLQALRLFALRIELGFKGDDESRFRNRLLTLYSL